MINHSFWTKVGTKFRSRAKAKTRTTLRVVRQDRPRFRNEISPVAGVAKLAAAAAVAFLGLNPFIPTPSYAGIFGIPRLVEPGRFAIGVEPELSMTGGAALGVNAKYIHGISDLSNLTGIIGTGGGNRQFRLGGSYSFDFFPDNETQPGIGIALQGLFVQLPVAGSLELTAIPYLHKTLKIEQGLIEPFVGIPVGLTLSSGQYKTIASIAVGSLFQHNEHFRSVFELGVSLQNAYTYVSGGLIYYH